MRDLLSDVSVGVTRRGIVNDTPLTAAMPDWALVRSGTLYEYWSCRHRCPGCERRDRGPIVMRKRKIVNKIYELAPYVGEESGGPRWAPAHYRRRRSI